MRMRPIAGQPRAFVFLPGTNPARADRLVQRLLWQGIEVSRTDRDATLSGATSSMGGAPQELRVPKGSYIVPLDQPASRLARTILEFDPRMTTAFLQEERKELEKNSDSRLYDVTAWSFPLAYGVGCVYAFNRTRREHGARALDRTDAGCRRRNA